MKNTATKAERRRENGERSSSCASPRSYVQASVLRASFSVLLALALLIPSISFAAQSTFTTSLTTTGVTDITPPTIPTGLNATAVSSTQIDLSWTASTDNFSVAGYRIFRDSAFLATTTLTSFADQSLTPETQYGYTVEAFDAAINLSGQSAEAFATTTATPVPTPTPSGGPTGGGSSGTQFRILGLSVSAGQDQATVSFNTNFPAQTTVLWGTTPDFEGGSISSAFYSRDHQSVIPDLAQGTQYYLRVEAADDLGLTIAQDLTFTTVASPVATPLPNPSDFTATPNKSDIMLAWTNPADPRFAKVRVIRSEAFFPKDPFDGVPVYEGAGTSFDDTKVNAGKTYYYSIFAEGADGTFSSGALAQARIAKPGETATASSSNPFASVLQSALTDPKIAALTLADFDFIQEGKTLYVSPQGTVAINGSENLTVSLDYGKVPEILKTIAVTLADPNDLSKVFTFLLRVNADRSAYQATIGALGRSGNYGMNVVVLDYQNQGLKRIQGNIQALAFASLQQVQQKFDPLAIAFVILLALAFLIFFILARRRRPRQGQQTVPVGT